jgi:hypothetical protein
VAWKPDKDHASPLRRAANRLRPPDAPWCVLRDPSSGDWFPVAVGDAPCVWRVAAARSRLDDFELDSGVGGVLSMFKDLVPVELRIYPMAYAVAPDELRDVDLLRVGAGSTRFGTTMVRYMLWQRHAEPHMEELNLLQVRAALVSPWLRLVREGREDASRGIATHRLRD